jgi:hypothetical protein
MTDNHSLPLPFRVHLRVIRYLSQITQHVSRLLSNYMDQLIKRFMLVLDPGVNFRGYDFQANDTQFLSALLLYHLAQGIWTESDLNSSATIIPTRLSDNVGNMALFQDNSSQVMSCDATHNGIEILDQPLSASVVGTLQYEHLTVHFTDAVIGMPGNFSTVVQDLRGFSGVQTSAGFDIDSFDAIPDVTQFIPIDAAFQSLDTTNLANAPPRDLFLNHVSFLLDI